MPTSENGALLGVLDAEHLEIEASFEATRRAFRSGELELACSAFAALRGGLEAHFERESRLYFPTIRALRPQREDRLRTLDATHDELRAHLQEIATNLAAQAFEEAEGAFEELARAFERHERDEEALARSVEGGS